MAVKMMRRLLSSRSLSDIDLLLFVADQALHVEHIQTDAMLANGYGELEWLRGSADVLATVARLKNNPLVAFAEPNGAFTHSSRVQRPVRHKREPMGHV